ncbi:HpcH/HpaI aldolase/citrate lyase family protein [Corynebacterium halotolerans]|uniref:Citrate lyase n=1 Tax=Corynebacterium halotolerans YIM 70093 = DSM 44683 TaxID=1121362 RepID=M1P5D3_9CORY|nr:CoA ester lyase [Corynebacterium halotolerans]AGF71871.1 citrate lyase [Corynebacterium halotolerans YIM 70093 = DSM 44683]
MESHITGPAVMFAPAHRAELIPKAYQRADMVIIDLEDGAGDGDRRAMHDAVRSAELQPGRTILRTSGPDYPGFTEDVALARELGIGPVMVPKLTGSIPAELAGLQVIAMIETPQAVANITTLIGHDDVVGLFWGAEDLITLLGGTHSRFQEDEATPGVYRDVIRHARAQVLLHAAAAGKFAVDAIHADFRDVEGQFAEALDAARSGFAATACIHPAQVEAVRRAYRPEERQLEWARKVVAGAESVDGAFQVDGMMVDAPLITQARRILERAGETGGGVVS